MVTQRAGTGRGPRKSGPGLSPYGQEAVTFVASRRPKTPPISFRGVARISGKKIAGGTGRQGRVPSSRRLLRTGKISSTARGAGARVASQKVIAGAGVKSRRAGPRTTGGEGQGCPAGQATPRRLGRRTTTGSTGHGGAPVSKGPAISRKGGRAGRVLVLPPLPDGVKVLGTVGKGPPVLALGNAANGTTCDGKGRKTVAGRGICPPPPYTPCLRKAFRSLSGRKEGGVLPRLADRVRLGQGPGLGVKAHPGKAQGPVEIGGVGKRVKPC